MVQEIEDRALSMSSRALLLGMAAAAAALCLGCGSAQAEPSYTSADPVAQQEFDRARAAYQQGRNEEASQLFSSFIVAHQADPLRPAAELHLGRIARGQQSYQEAVLWLERAAAADDETLALFARRELGEALVLLGEPARALEVLEPLAGTQDGREAAGLYATLAEASAAVDDQDRLIRYLDAICRYGDRAVCRNAQTRMTAAIGALEAEALARLSDTLPRNGRAWAIVTARLGVIEAERGNGERAAQLLTSLEQAGAEDGPDVAALRTAISQAQQIDWSAVGALLPLSGRARLIGEQMRAGLELALSRNDGDLRIVYRDTASPDGNVGAMITDLVENERVAAIIGPVDAADSEVAAARAQELGVPLLALSIRPELTRDRRWVFRAFQSNETEVRTLVDHAFNGRGLRTMAILYPEHSYGQVMNELVGREFTAIGGTIVVSLGYDPAQTSFVEIGQELARQSFDALVVPDRGRTLSLIAPALATAGLWSRLPDQPPEGARAIQLLLPSTAFDPEVIRQAGRYLQGAVFSSVFWADNPEATVAGFVESYRARQERAPTAYSSQAHDALQVIKAARTNASSHSRLALLEALLGLERAVTVGRFEGFDEQGEPLAPFRLLQIDGETFVPVE